MAVTPATNFDGKVVAVADQVTIMGRVVSHTGTGSTASMTVVTLMGDSITVPANNAYAPQTGDSDLFSIDGKGYADAYRITVPGVVTAVTGLGHNAQLTVTLVGGTSVTVRAGAVRSTSQA
jgi:hypothetical protein